MAVISGTMGSVTSPLNSTGIAGIRNWSLDIGAGDLNASQFGSTWVQTDSGIKEWSGSFEGLFDDTDSIEGAVYSALIAGTKPKCWFYVGPSDHFSGTVVITGAAPAQSHDGLGALSYSFKGHGPLVRT